eukprot:1176390-Pleurochrysis_carterae.AAC.1
MTRRVQLMQQGERESGRVEKAEGAGRECAQERGPEVESLSASAWEGWAADAEGERRTPHRCRIINLP